jgi:hypothetical protein
MFAAKVLYANAEQREMQMPGPARVEIYNANGVSLVTFCADAIGARFELSRRMGFGAFYPHRTQ